MTETKTHNDALKSEPAKAASAPAQAAAAAPAAKATTAATKTAAPAKARKPRAAKAKAAPKARKAPVRRAAKSNQTSSTTVSKGTTAMKNEANRVADGVQAVFGDVNARAKTAIERNSRFAEEITELSKGNVEALVASTKVAAKGVEKIGQEVAEFSRKSFEDASAAIKSFAEVKSPTELFQLQGQFARTAFDSMIAESSRMSETMIKLAGDMVEPITSRASVAAERVKKIAA